MARPSFAIRFHIFGGSAGIIAGATIASSEVDAAAGRVLQAASGTPLGSAPMKPEVAGFLAIPRAA